MKKFYTLQEYVMEINGKKVFEFRVKAYPKYENAMFTFGKSEYGNITPYAEEFLNTKKEGEERKAGMEEYIRNCEEYELYNTKKHGLLTDYDWSFNSISRINFGTLKKQPLQVR